MKKISLLVPCIFFFVTILRSQAPQSFTWQGVARNINGLVTGTVNVRASIRQGTPNGTTVYSETTKSVTNPQGVFTLDVGKGDPVLFNTINWANGTYFLNIELDPSGGTQFTDLGATQILSVPYALHAQLSTTALDDMDRDSTNELQNLTKLNDTISLDKNGGSITLNDDDPSNEIQQLTFSFSGDTLHLQNGGFVIIPGISAANTNGVAYPAGTISCQGTPTEIVDVTNPVTGKTWMDRNLGAKRVATSSTDVNSYGDLYQWGRPADGHQCRNSATTSTLSSNDLPAQFDFITPASSPYDWRSPQNMNLWQGVNGTNNPCPKGYRLPTEEELNAERLSWSSNSGAGAFASPLKLPLAGYRSYSNGLLYSAGSGGNYWTSTVDGNRSKYLDIYSWGASISTYYRAYGCSVRCIKD